MYPGSKDVDLRLQLDITTFMEDCDFRGHGRGLFRHGATSTDLNLFDDSEPSTLVLKPELHIEGPLWHGIEVWRI